MIGRHAFPLLALVFAVTSVACASSSEAVDDLSQDELGSGPTLTIATRAEAPPESRFDLRFESRAANGAPATVTASPMPNGASINPVAEGFQFSWKPTAADVGEHVVVFTARAAGRRTRRTVRLVVTQDAVSTATPSGELDHRASGTLTGQIRVTHFGFVQDAQAPLECRLVGSNPGTAKAQCTITIDQYTFDTRTDGWQWEGPWKYTKEAEVDRVTGRFQLDYSEAAGRTFSLGGRFRNGTNGYELSAHVAYSLSWHVPWGGTASAIQELDGTFPLVH